MIKHIIYHELAKEQFNTAKLTINPNEHPSDDINSAFLAHLIKAYSGKAGKGYGYFEPDTDSYPMPKILKEYLTSPDTLFESTSERMMKVLETEINRKPSASGGKVIIAHYVENAHDYLLVALLNEHVTFSANNWKMLQNESLDIEHLKFAGRVDLTAWQNGTARYISFLKGRDNVSQYFKLFLACNDVLIAQEETKKLVGLIEEFAEEKNLDTESKSDFFRRVQDYLYEINEHNEPFSADTFANRVWAHAPQELTEKLANDEKGISEGFIPDKRSVKALSTFSGKTKHWSLTFNRSAISDGEIELSNDKLIINNPPEKLIRAFR
jgi:hypothetical protein|nr:MAG TPA: 37-kD nucleoid-associated bacterial protein [Caudoviricetes sp.]